jgi:predicted metal-dependent HD superfamily phosphohydrolase
MTDLPTRWPLPGRPALRDRLLAAYGDGRRGYHDLTHLAEVLDHVATLADAAGDIDAVVLAAWFHDAVYDGAGDDEERSAVLAVDELTAAGVDERRVAEVARLVRLTASHRPGPGDRNGGVRSDADLAVLAAEPERYASYVAGVRAEYAHVPDVDFRRGRAAVLRDLLAKPALFHTPPARDLWEERARANVTRELADLERESGRMDRLTGRERSIRPE